jgi:hypothetical protein
MVTERPRMSRRRFRLSFGFVACLFLGFGGGACSEADGARCVQNSDCSSGFCDRPGVTTEGGRCSEPGTTTSTGTGGTSSGGGAGGAGGTGGQAGSASQDAASSDAQAATDAATDAAHVQSDGASD